MFYLWLRWQLDTHDPYDRAWSFYFITMSKVAWNGSVYEGD